MKKALCNFIAVLNQTVKKKKSSFDFIYFRQAPTLLRALVDTGYVQYYTRTGTLRTIHLRFSHDGPILSGIKQNSKPSKKVFVR
jgi:ribosomal protein S8